MIERVALALVVGVLVALLVAVTLEGGGCVWCGSR